MSDIIYTPPASSGGGQNPTTNYIPLNNGTSSFVDSDIYNQVNGLLSITNNFQIDFSTRTTQIGDYNITTNGTTLVINDTNQFIATLHNNQQTGLGLGFINQFYWLGDYNDTLSGAFVLVDNTNRAITLTAGDLFNNTTLYIDDLNSTFRTLYQGNDVGLQLNFVNHIYSFGDFNNIGNGTSLIINDANELIKTKHQGNDIGLKLDFADKTFKFGDFDNANNKTLLSIDDPNASIILGNLGGDTSGYRYNYLGNGGNNFFHLEVGCYPDGVGLFMDYQQNPTNDFVGLYSNGQTSIFSNNNQPLSLNALGNNNNLIILDPAGDKISFQTNGLNFVGAGLQSNTAGGSSGRHLQIVLNGTTYKIALLNP